MKQIIRYIELKGAEHADADEAWIARAWQSASGDTVYFNDMALKRSQGTDSNRASLEYGDLQWLSGVKKERVNRHWGGSIHVDESLLPGYEEHTGGKCLAGPIPKLDLPEPDIKRFHAFESENISYKRPGGSAYASQPALNRSASDSPKEKAWHKSMTLPVMQDSFYGISLHHWNLSARTPGEPDYWSVHCHCHDVRYWFSG